MNVLRFLRMERIIPHGGQNEQKTVSRQRIAASAAAWIDPEIGSSELPGTQKPDRPKRVIKLDAKPTRVELDLAQTAVVLVDMQNDFCSKGGDLDREGVDLSIIQRVIPTTRVALATARKAGLKIIYTKMGFQPDLSDVGVRGSRNWLNNRDVGAPVKSPDGTTSRVLNSRHVEH
jgi:Isochorismatase family